MSSLLEGLNSDYLHAANRLRSSHEIQAISVYVEGFEDIAFWHNILSPYEATQHIKFDIKTYSQTRFIDGCESLKKLFPNTEEREGRITGYRNSRKNIETLLATNDNFKDCFLFAKIEQDIQILFAQRKQT